MLKWFGKDFLLILMFDFVGEIEGYEVLWGSDRTIEFGGGFFIGEFRYY